MKWNTNSLTQLLGIQHPIFLAPMAIATTPALAAGVAKGGGLGGIGCAVLSAKELDEYITDFRALAPSGAPLHVGFFTHKRPNRDEAREARAVEHVRPYYQKYGIEEVPKPKEAFLPFAEDAVDVLIAKAPEVASFHFGLPDVAMTDRLRSAGITLIGCATTVAEAQYLEGRGMQAIIAQGWEAGGHRGSFQSSYDGGSVGTLALVPQIVDAVSVPVIAAGGISDGRGIAAALCLGASAVQLGTAFLRCPEANVPEPHRRALRESRDEDTRLTRAFSGGLARGLRNDYLDQLAEVDDDLPPFPLMNPLSKPLRAASSAAGEDNCLPLWAGQAAPLTRDALASDMISALVEETDTVFNQIAR